MHPSILSIISHATGKGMECQIHTNLTLLDKKLILKLIDLKLGYLTGSLWAGTARTYVLTHPNRNEGTFYTIENALKFLASSKNEKHKPYVRLHNVITNLNYRDTGAMVDFARNVKADAVSFSLLDAIPSYTDSLLLSGQQRKELLGLCAILRKNGKRILFDFNEFMRRISASGMTNGEYDKDVVNAIPCYAGWLFARLNANGTINSCLKSHRIPVGSIYDNRFAQIWNSEKQREFRKKTLCFMKDDPYFSLIGNNPYVTAGCWRGCDDLGLNIRTYRILRLIAPFLHLGK